MKLKAILVFLQIVFLTFSVFGAEVKTESTMNLSVEGISTVEMECGAGSLKVEGVAGLKQVEVKATIVVSGIEKDDIYEFIKDNVDLSLEKKGNNAKLISNIDSGFINWIASLFHSKEARIDLYVRVPMQMSLVIADSSGAIDIAGIQGNVVLADASGNIQLQDIGGNLVLTDASGNAVVKNIGGNAIIHDGSGELELLNINGKLTVDDGSGDILIDGVNGDVEIIDAGSGELTIRNVKGKVKK